jgi:hypothetical protein
MAEDLRPASISFGEMQSTALFNNNGSITLGNRAIQPTNQQLLHNDTLPASAHTLRSGSRTAKSFRRATTIATSPSQPHARAATILLRALWLFSGPALS